MDGVCAVPQPPLTGVPEQSKPTLETLSVPVGPGSHRAAAVNFVRWVSVWSAPLKTVAASAYTVIRR